ncbi:MAG TPA: ABC transporter ATP-binding protein [Solirubrobacteraceae bacterium]|nr:ABC transporter ATP-binding protein [Solirubrobacteraceae bacterium]
MANAPRPELAREPAATADAARAPTGEPRAGVPASMRARLSLLIGDRRGLIAALAACSIVSGLSEAALLTLIAYIAASLVTGGHEAVKGHGNGLASHLLNLHAGTGTLIVIAFGLALARLLLQIPLSVLPARIAADVQARIRRELFEAFSNASWTVQSSDREGQLQETISSQVMQAVAGALGTTQLIISSFQFAVLMITALALNALAALLVGVTSVLMFGLLRPMRNRGGRYSKGLSRAQVRFAGGIAESNRLAEEAHVFGVFETTKERVAALIERAQGFFFRSLLLTRLVTNIYQSLIYLLLVAGLGGLYLVGGNHAGTLGGVVLLLLRAGTAGQVVQGTYQTLVQSMPFIERTQLAIERYRENADVRGDTPLAAIDTVSFEHVCFAYGEDAPVLRDVSFQIEGGEAVGIVGPSGAGKSTLVQLLLRLRPPLQGRYLVNGIPAERIAASDWHRQVSYVPQEPRLLHASVAENIRFFRDIDDAAIERAARLARIHDDVTSWDRGYETIVGPRADAVSGGQQQRICLARALAAQPQMLILDEPTSALDPRSEALIGESLLAIQSNLTLIIVAHRMSTLDMCDRVMVILDGRLAAFDTRAALQRDNDYYRHASRLAAGGAAL